MIYKQYFSIYFVIFFTYFYIILKEDYFYASIKKDRTLKITFILSNKLDSNLL